MTTDYTTAKTTVGQRRVMLAAVDAAGLLPADAIPRVLRSIPETWARTADGGRYLTDEGRAVLAPLGRLYLLARANPESGALPGSTGHADMLALVRDGLAVLQDQDGRPAPTADRWEHGNRLCITERGRRLVGMPLTAPAFAERHPVRSRALWKPEGEPARPVTILGWPLANGTVYVLPSSESYTLRERPVPVAQIHPAPQAPAKTDRPDDRRTTMPNPKPEQSLDNDLEELRGLAAEVVKPISPRAATWEAVKGLEERATAGYELAERFREFDERATAERSAPRDWRRGRHLDDEEVAALVERWPDLAALGPAFVRHLVGVGFAPFQMTNLVKKVQGHGGRPDEGAPSGSAVSDGS
ncbi:hypothetical protein ACPCAG_31310 [Streptomyces pseudogriseolus]|uniref:hypothetical protein n=1 Tax=Streptomyces pseudogriseolus TaxID=36817 RepID=UPI003FA2827A